MPKSITKIAEEIKAVLPPLPVGFFVKPDDGDNVIVGSDMLAFVITRKCIEDGGHLITARKSYVSLMLAMRQYFNECWEKAKTYNLEQEGTK